MKKNTKIEAEIWPLADVKRAFQEGLADSEFELSKEIKNPKLKRQKIARFNWVSSCLHYLKEDDFEKRFNRIVQWQNEIFTDATAISKLDHLKEEIEEVIIDIAIDGLDMHLEFADCFMLLIGAASKCEMSFEDICQAIDEKMEINKKRKWGKPDANGVVRHIK